MAFDRNHHRSIISSAESDPSPINPSNPLRNYNKPLINSAINPSNMSDEEIARQQQEHLYSDYSMDVDPPEVIAAAAAAASYNPQQVEEIDNDAAIARQLQEEEYSRDSLRPRFSSNQRKTPSSASNCAARSTLSDAQYAVQLQAEEERNQRRQQQRQRAVLSSQQQRRIPSASDTDEPEVIPFPFQSRPSQQRPSSSVSANRTAINIASALQSLAPLFRPASGVRRAPGHGAHNLETTTDDFGPNDYENLIQLDQSVGNKPLTADEINRLPTEKFQRRATKNEEDNKCNICWDEFKSNDTLRRLKCLHVYHKDCIDPWLKTNCSCPICRLPTK